VRSGGYIETPKTVGLLDIREILGGSADPLTVSVLRLLTPKCGSARMNIGGNRDRSSAANRFRIPFPAMEKSPSSAI
jgi:hypothetical protein